MKSVVFELKTLGCILELCNWNGFYVLDCLWSTVLHHDW